MMLVVMALWSHFVGCFCILLLSETYVASKPFRSPPSGGRRIWWPGCFVAPDSSMRLVASCSRYTISCVKHIPSAVPLDRPL